MFRPHPNSRAARQLRFSDEATFTENKNRFLALLTGYTIANDVELTDFFNAEIAPFKNIQRDGVQPVSYYEAIMCSAIIASAEADNLDALQKLNQLEPDLRQYAQKVNSTAEANGGWLAPFDQAPCYRDGGYSKQYHLLVTKPDYNPSEHASPEFAEHFDALIAGPRCRP